MSEAPRSITEKQTPKRPLPGDRPRAEELAEIIRVNQAGEYGAVRIYAGQLAVMGHHERFGPMLRHMAEQEKQHLAAFNKIMVQRRVRPSLLSPFWHASGYALGAVTALMGERAAMACTAAVEEVIDEHYEDQRRRLEESDPDLAQTIARFQAEEVGHRETALSHGAEEMPGYGLLSGAIKVGCRLAIALAKKV